MKVGLYGGSFNPVHYGHLITAVRAAELRSLDKMILMPAYISPLRQDAGIISGSHRLEMLRLAVQGDSLFEISDYEIQRGGVSYTIDTIKFLKTKYPDIELIIGYDNFIVLDKWREPDELLKLVKIVVLRRDTRLNIQPTHKYADQVAFIESPSIDISSSEIRERLQANRTIAYLTPPPVAEYIEKHHLYR